MKNHKKLLQQPLTPVNSYSKNVCNKALCFAKLLVKACSSQRSTCFKYHTYAHNHIPYLYAHNYETGFYEQDGKVHNNIIRTCKVHWEATLLCMSANHTIFLLTVVLLKIKFCNRRTFMKEWQILWVIKGALKAAKLHHARYITCMKELHKYCELSQVFKLGCCSLDVICFIFLFLSWNTMVRSLRRKRRHSWVTSVHLLASALLGK